MMENKSNIVKIIGVDASTTNIGWAIVSYHREQLIASGTIALSGTFYERLKMGPRLLKRALVNAGIDGAKVIVIEHSFFTNNPEVGKKISYMIGACLSAMLPLVEVVKEISPTEIKLCFAGKGRAEKQEVIEAVKKRFGVQIKSNDEADAIAIAASFCVLHKNGHFEQKKAARAERQAVVANKRAITRAVKKGKNSIPGELQL